MQLSNLYAVCQDNTGYESSLIVGKTYHVLVDNKSAKDDLVRIIDETGEDYLFPKDYFILGTK